MLRAIAFNTLFYLWTAVIVLLGLPLPRLPLLRLGRFWAKTSLDLLRVVAGIETRVSGLEHVPDTPVIVASKHQSAWEIFALVVALPPNLYVLKQELTWIPLFGWLLRRVGHIAVDRGAGAAALKAMLAQAKRRVQEGYTLIVFPQGTRTPPGTKVPYLPGVAALYGGLGLPVVPAAVNSGLFWPRRRLCLRPGTIDLEFQPAIAPGLDRRTFLATLEERIETASERLAASALRRGGSLSDVAGEPL